ncbi:MAG: tetratricopeptide repeat protein [Burkholderiales bacterium]
MLRKLIAQWFAQTRRSAAKATDNQGPARQTGTDAQVLATELALGKRAHLAGDHKIAQAHYRNALAIDAQHPETLFCLGVAHHSQKQLDEALRLCHQAYELDSSQATWRESLMHIANDIGKAEGIARCEVWVRDKTDFASWMGLGNALRHEGQLEAARHAYQQALEHQPRSVFAWRRLGCLYAAMGALDEADRCFRHSAAGGLRPDALLHFSNDHLEGLYKNRAQLVKGIASPDGNFTPTESPIVLLLCGDSVYMHKFAYALIKSARKHGNTDACYHLHVVNPDGQIAALIEAIRAELTPSIRYSWETLALSPDVDPRTYYACARFLHLPWFIGQYQRPILCLDLDLLVSGDLGEIFRLVDSRDVGLLQWHATRWDPWEQFSASVLYVRASSGGLAFASLMAAYIQEAIASQTADWFLDQIALYAAHALIRQHPEIATTVYLPTNVCRVAGSVDETPDSSSVLWTLAYRSHNGAELPAAYGPYLSSTNT